MYHRLLVPLDGSRLAEGVLPAAAALARLLGAELLLLHLLEERAPQTVHGQRHLAEAAEAEEYLRRCAAGLRAAGITVTTHVHSEPVRDAALGIAAHRREFRFDLVIMSVHGRGRAARLLAGGLAQKVAARGGPVLLLHAEDRRLARRFPCRSVLLPLDPRRGHEQSFSRALAFALGLATPVHLAAVVQTLSTLPPPELAGGRLAPRTVDALLAMSAEQAQLLLDSRRRQARSLGLEVSTCLLRGAPARAIVGAARRLGSDLVILGTHGRVGLEAFWAGSVAHAVYSRSLLPLLLIPEDPVSDGRGPG